MKKILTIGLIVIGLAAVSCGGKECKECNGCATKATATLCEEDFETASDYQDQVDNYVSDGCSCSDK